MRNLRVVAYKSHSVINNFPTNLHLSDATAFCFDHLGEKYCSISSGIFHFSSRKFIDAWQQNDLHRIILLEYLTDDFIVFALFSNGDVYLIDFETLKSRMESLNIGDNEIKAASWSPNGHLLICFLQEELCFISRQLEIERRIKLSDTIRGLEELMTIGWGSLETMFQGANARKQPAKKMVTESTEICNDKRALISWAADSHYFALSFVDESCIRRCSTWNSDGDLISRFESSPFVEPSLAYKPTGNLIAISQLEEGNQKIVFFERNGQYFSEFSLHHISGRVEKLCWSIDSKVLSIHLVDCKDGFVDEVQFWYTSNGKWFLKYRMIFNTKLLFCAWDLYEPLRYHLIRSDGQICSIDFDFIYNFYDGNILVIDGNHVQVTNLYNAVMPPPLCHYTLTFPETVCEIAQSDCGAAFLLCNNQISQHILRSTDEALSLGLNSMYKEESCISVNDFATNTIACSNLIHFNSALFLTLYGCGVSQRIGIKDDGIEQWEIKDSWIGLKDGNSSSKMLRLEILADQESCKKAFFSGPISSPDYNGLIFPEKSDENQNIGVSYFVNFAGGDIIKQLLINGKVAYNDVSSLYCTNNNLFLISNDKGAARLFLVKLADVFQAVRNGKNFPELSDGRSVETKSSIIGVGKYEVYLQMPRGNLETVYLRQLLIDELKTLLDQKDYKTSMLLMRKHCIDLNLFYDHNPQLFINSIGEFVKTVENGDLLNSFILNINHDNVKKGIYKQFYPKDDSPNFNEDKEKVTHLLNELQKYILGTRENKEKFSKLYVPYLSTYLVIKPPRLTEALNDVWDTYNTFGINNIKQWLDHISTLVPQANLFNESLATYNLSLALLVSKYTDIDPKEVQSVLSSFGKQNDSVDYYQRYLIDAHLGRFENALYNIAKVDEKLEEAIRLIKQRHLYSQSLLAFRNSKHLAEICVICAEDMLKRNLHFEAGILFWKGNCIEKASECMMLCNEYRTWIVLTDGALPIETRNSILTKMANYFKAKHLYKDAADILMLVDREANKEDILTFYCQGHHWKESINFVKYFPDLIPSLRTNAKCRCMELLDFVSCSKRDLEKFTSRLTIVRDLKKMAIEKLVLRMEANDGLEALSETSSVQSNLSASSTLSTASRHRKRIERKKSNLKEGNQFEDAALLNAIKSLIRRIDDTQDELKSFLPLLILEDMIGEGCELQSKYCDLLQRASLSVQNAWPSYICLHTIPLPLTMTLLNEDGVSKVPGEIGLMPEKINYEPEMIPPELRTNVQWKLKIFECP